MQSRMDLLLLLGPALAAALMTFSDFKAQARNTSLLGITTPSNSVCGGSNTLSLGTVNTAGAGQYVRVGCANSAVAKGALNDAQLVQYKLNPYPADLYYVFVVPSCELLEKNEAQPLNGDNGDYVTSPFSSPTYTCTSPECCLFVFCDNLLFSCSQGKLTTDFTLRTNAGVLAGIIIGALAAVAIAVACVVSARRKAAADSSYASMPAGPGLVVVQNAAAPSYQQQQPTYQQQPVYQQQEPAYQQQSYQQQPAFMQPPPGYQPQQYQQPPPQQWR